MTTTPDFGAFVARVKNEITRDILSNTVPADVADYSELHEYVDANGYGGTFDDGFSNQFESFEAEMDFITDMQNEVHEWLVAGRPGTVVVLADDETLALLSMLLDVNDDDAELSENSGATFDTIDDLRNAALAARTATPLGGAS